MRNCYSLVFSRKSASIEIELIFQVVPARPLKWALPLLAGVLARELAEVWVLAKARAVAEEPVMAKAEVQPNFKVLVFAIL